MNLNAARLSLVQKILSLNQESVLEQIDEIIENEMIIGFTSEGLPLTKRLYDNRIAIAEEQLEKGETTSQDDIEKESENW